MEFNFTLTEQESQMMLNSLMKEPYIEVFELINKVQSQAIDQRQKIAVGQPALENAHE